MRTSAIMATILLLTSTSAWAASISCLKDVPCTDTPLIEDSDGVWPLSAYGIQPIEQLSASPAAEPYQPTMPISPGIHDYDYSADNSEPDLSMTTHGGAASKDQPMTFPTPGCDRPNMTLSITALGPHHLQIECK